MQPCVDLMIVDMPEGLLVPGISIPSTLIPQWNFEPKDWLQPIFDFADQCLQDDSAIIIIYPFRLVTKSNILGYCKSNGFNIRKEWWGMNRLHLASPVNPALTVWFFSNIQHLTFLTLSSRSSFLNFFRFTHNICKLRRLCDLVYAWW